MTTLANRPNQALLVIDVQRDVVANAYEREAVVGTINSLVHKARTEEVPVIWVQHGDDDLPANTDGWQIVDELAPLEGEAIVHKQFRDSFEETTLESILDEHGVGSLVVTGSQTDFCVRWTLHGAHLRGYDTVLVTNAHTTDDPPSAKYPTAAQTITLLNQVWGTQAASGRTASVSPASEVTFSSSVG